MNKASMAAIVDRSRLVHTVKVTDWCDKDLEMLLQWCKSNCRHGWANRLLVFFFFEDETDAFWFKMSWG